MSVIVNVEDSASRWPWTSHQVRSRSPTKQRSRSHSPSSRTPPRSRPPLLSTSSVSSSDQSDESPPPTPLIDYYGYPEVPGNGCYGYPSPQYCPGCHHGNYVTCAVPVDPYPYNSNYDPNHALLNTYPTQGYYGNQPEWGHVTRAVAPTPHPIPGMMSPVSCGHQHTDTGDTYPGVCDNTSPLKAGGILISSHHGNKAHSNKEPKKVTFQLSDVPSSKSVNTSRCSVSTSTRKPHRRDKSNNKFGVKSSDKSSTQSTVDKPNTKSSVIAVKPLRTVLGRRPTKTVLVRPPSSAVVTKEMATNTELRSPRQPPSPRTPVSGGGEPRGGWECVVCYWRMSGYYLLWVVVHVWSGTTMTFVGGQVPHYLSIPFNCIYCKLARCIFLNFISNLHVFLMSATFIFMQYFIPHIYILITKTIKVQFTLAYQIPPPSSCNKLRFSLL